MSRAPAFARTDTPDSVVSEMEEEDSPDDFGELITEIGVLRTKSWSEMSAVPSDSLTDLIETESQTDGVRKEKLHDVKAHIMGMSAAYRQLLEVHSGLSQSSSADIARLRSQLQAAEERAVSAERRCSELKEDLQKVLDWIAGGQLTPMPKLTTTPSEHGAARESPQQRQVLAEQEQQVASLQEDLRCMEHELSERERRGREDRQRWEKEVAGAQGRAEQAEAALAQHKEMVEGQMEKDSAMVTRVEALERENVELKAGVGRSAAEVDSLKVSLSETSGKMEQRDAEISGLQRALEEQKEGFEKEGAQLTKTVEDLGTQLSQQCAERDQLLEEKEGLEGRVLQCSQELEELRRHIEELRQDKEALGGELEQQQEAVQSLQASRAQAEADIEALKKGVSTREEALRQLMSALHGLAAKVCGTLEGMGEGEGEFAILQQHADSLDESLHSVLQEIEQLREKWAESQAAVREQESRLSRLGEERSRLAAEIEVLQERTAGLEQLLKERDSKDVSLQATISQLQQDLQCAHSDYDKAVTEREAVATATQELEGDLVHQRDLLQGQLAQQQAALEELGRAQKRLQGEYAQCCDEVSSKQRSVRALETELHEKGAELDDLSTRLGAATGDRNALQLQLDQYRRQMEALQSEMGERETAKDHQLQEVAAERVALQEECEKIQRMVEERDKTLAGLNRVTSDLEAQRKKAHKDVARHREVIASLERKLQEVQEDFDGLHSQLSEREKELHACRQAAILTSDTMNEKIRQLTLELEALRLSHTSQLSAIQSEYSSAARSLHSHESLARAREEEVRGLSLRVAELEAELAGLVLKREACEEQLQEERQAAGALQEELGVKEAELAAREAQLRQTQEGVRQLEKRLTSYESDHRDVLSLVGQLRGPKQKWTDLGSHIHNEELREELKDLEEVLQELWGGQADLEQRISQMMEALTKAEFEKKSLQTKLSSEQAEHLLLQERVQQQESSERALKETLAGEQAKLCEWTEERDSLRLQHDSLARRESVLQSQLRDALHQLGVAHSQTSKDTALVVRLQQQVEDQRQQVEELCNQCSEQQEALGQLQELADRREREVLQCQVTTEQLREEERRRAALEQELREARKQLTQAEGQLMEEQAHLQGVQQEVEVLQSQLDTVRGEAALLRSAKSQVELQLSEQQLSEQEEVERARTQLSSTQMQLHSYVVEIRSLKDEVEKMGGHAREAEEEVERLKNSLSAAQRAHLLTQKELLTTRGSLTSSQDLAHRLQQDCDTLANQMSSWAQDHRSSQETLSERVRALQKDIATLQADRESLLRRAEVLEATNSKLKTQLEWATAVCRTMKAPGPHSNSSVTHVQATLDLSFQHKQSSGPSSSGSGSDPADSALDWESQYAASLQRGLSASKLQGGKGEFPSVSLKKEDSDMDKHYWMTRANELSLQLQQCTEFWSEKVRLLSSRLEESGKAL